MLCGTTVFRRCYFHDVHCNGVGNDRFERAGLLFDTVIRHFISVKNSASHKIDFLMRRRPISYQSSVYFSSKFLNCLRFRRQFLPLFQNLFILPTPSTHDTGSGMQRFPAVSALPSPPRCSGSHTDRQVPLFLSSLPACRQLPASSACR